MRAEDRAKVTASRGVPGPAVGRPIRRLALAFVSPNSYGMVLGLIVATYVAAVSASEPHASPIVVVMQAVTVWFALRTSRTRRSTRLIADVILTLAVLAALGSEIGSPDEAWKGLSLVSALLYFVAPIAIIRHLVSRTAVDLETVLGALSAYLLIGMFFAFTYKGIGSLQTGPFFGSEGVGTTQQILFFSFTTLTTTGYGNLVPAENPGQTFAVAEMLIGQLFLIATFGKVVNAWRPTRWATATPGVTDETGAASENPDEAGAP